MSQLPVGKMPLLLRLICFVLIAVALFSAVNMVTGIAALLDAKMGSHLFAFVLNQLITVSFVIIPLLVFVRLVLSLIHI